MKKVLIVSGLLVGFLLGPAARASNRISVTAHARKTASNDIVVKFHLTNCGNEKIEIENGDLPWQQTFTTLIAYVGSGDFARALPNVRPFADYPAGAVSVAPRTSIEGTLDLSFYVPSLKKISDYADVVIFWSYRLNDYPGTHLKQMLGGMLTVGGPVQSHSCDGKSE